MKSSNLLLLSWTSDRFDDVYFKPLVMKTTTTFIIFLLFAFNLQSQSILAGIPDSLKDNANEIILSDETIYTVTDVKTSSLTRKYKAIIMNSYASDRNEIILYYSDFRTIKDAFVRVLNKDGTEVESFKLKHFNDFSTKSGLASDSRAKYLKVKQNSYPHLIEVEYTINYLGSMFYPRWTPQTGEKQSVINASFTINNHLAQPIRQKAVNVNISDSSKNGNTTRYFFSVDSLKAFTFEPFSFTLDEYAPIVYSAPNHFEMDNYAGNMSSWEDFGKWILQLNQNRNTMTVADLQPVYDITKDLESTADKVKAVYEYLQNNTRYVSIQLGIGGWQPFETKFVHEHKYGDCKALSFYTQSLLEGLDIPSYYTLINAGKYRDNVDPDFPNAHFNHAILTVPLEQDTVWLECTSQTNPFGYLGTFTSNRNALMITPEGGKLIRTRKYELSENVQQTNASVTVNEDGSAHIKLDRNFKGMEIENKKVNSTSLKSKTDQEKWFIDNHSWGSLKLNQIHLTKPTKEVVPSAALEVELEMHKAAISSGKRLFYQPFVFTNLSTLKLADHARKVPIEVKYPFTQRDSIQVIFPEFYHPERKLKDVSVETKFGTYTRKVIPNDKGYLFIREFQFQSGTYPPEEYEPFRNFLKSVQKYDREKYVMINKT